MNPCARILTMVGCAPQPPRISRLTTLRSVILGLCAAGLSVAMVHTADTAHAQTPESSPAARTLFYEGVQLMDQGKYTAACAKFQASLTAFPGIGTRGKLAECYEKIGSIARAWDLYQEIIALAGQGTRAQVASARATALEPRIARLVVTVPAASNAEGLVVKIDGDALPRARLGGARALDPGEVLVEASAPGRKPWSQTVRAAAGSTVQVDVPPLEPESAPAAPVHTAHAQGPRSSASALPQPAPEPASTPEAPMGLGWQRIAGIATGGVGVVSLLLGGYFGLSAKSTYDGAFDSNCNSTTYVCNAAGQRDTESAHDQARTSTILFGTGAVLVVAGAVLFVTAPKLTKSAPAAGAVQVVPQVGMGQAGLMVRTHSW